MDQLAPLYQGILNPKILKINLNETKATCHDCLRSKKCSSLKEYFRADLKCCTYQPFLPNFIVGAILSDPEISEPTKKLITDRIESDQFVLPIGLFPSFSFQVEFTNRDLHQFGQTESWLCPFFNKVENQCNIWRYRGSVCTSYYCESNHGAKGKKFWKNFESYFSYFEWGIMEEVLVYKDFSPRQISDQLQFLGVREATEKEMAMQSIPPQAAQKYWNGYYEDKVKFFKDSYEFVLALKRKNVNEIKGSQGNILEDEVMKSYSSIGKLTK